MNNNDYSVEKLLADDSFLAYVHNTDKQAVSYWQNLIMEHPEQLTLIQEAAFMARTLALQPVSVSEDLIDQELEKLENSLTKSETIPLYPAAAKQKLSWWISWQAIAATILLLLTTAFAIWNYSQHPTAILTVTTNINSPAVLLLPDSSLVFLSGNSTIRYNKDWQDNTTRQVWLEGEAFFHVKPKPVTGGVKFQVYAGQAVIEVVGTRFNVLNRYNQTKVVLTAGKVNFRVKEGPEVKQIALVPGEMVSLTHNSLLPKKNKVNVQHYPVLKEEKIIFEDASVRKILLLLREHYGIHANLQDSAIADLKVSGSFPLNNEKVFLNTLAVVLNLDIEKGNNQEVYFRYK